MKLAAEKLAAVTDRRYMCVMKDFELILRGGVVVTPEGVSVSDIGIAEGNIVALGKELSGEASEEIDARGVHIFPGVIDAHVHFNEPGRAEWEGIETGSQALAAGGGTMFFDMPLNAHPPTCDVDSFDLKAAAASANSLTDFGLWGGLVPHNLEQLERLAERGVVGFKAFMSDSGIDDFPRANHGTLRKGMKRAAGVGALVAVHAESESITQKLSQEKMSRGKMSARDYLDSRPIEAELEAIRNAIDMAGDVGCKLHVVHVSSAEGVELITDAKKRGADVSCETCPHYLTLTENDMLKLGAVAKCAPPLRSPRERDALWERVIAGEVMTVGSDHSPSPPEMKQDTNFFKVWGGISGVQHLLSLLVGTGEAREHFGWEPDGETPALPGPALSLVAKLTSFNVAERFRLPKTKGRIEMGAEADFALVDFREKFVVRAEDLFYRHKQSPYVGRALTGRVVQTILRGQTIFKRGQIVGRQRGRLIKPL
ncbi:MAG TPA: allantoinase AllB [Verrucomicrobiae bacterium]|nr:allantoinase AllB [Verrucomicrobiae bacterium]